MPVGEDLLDVLTHFIVDERDGRARLEERVILGRRAVGVEAQDRARQMGVVRLGAAELIVGNPFIVPGAVVDVGRAAGKILQHAAPAHIPDKDVKLAILAERENAAVMVAARGLFLIALIRG